MTITAQTLLAELEKLAEADPIKKDDLEHFRALLQASGYFVRNGEDLIITFPPDADPTYVINNRRLLEQAIKNVAEQNEIFSLRVMARLGDVQEKPFGEFVRDLSDDMGLYGESLQVQDAQAPTLKEEVITDEPNPELEAAEQAASAELHSEIARDLNSIQRLSREEREDLKKTDEAGAANPAPYGQEAGGVAGLLANAGRLAVSPVTLTAKALNGGVNKLADWRKDRPSKYLRDMVKTEENLVKNLTLFRQGKFSDFDASVKSNGGWDPRLSEKFEHEIENDADFKRDWLLIKDEFKHYQFLASKAINLNKEHAEELEQDFQASTSRIGEAGGPVPMEMKMGIVKSTIEEESNVFKEFIKRFVAKLVKRVLNALGMDNKLPASPSMGI